jgi:geranylgeranylglycerol-phosphate geranylgeranyltransferase
MKQIKAFYKLSRPMTSLSGALAVLIGGYVAGTGAWGNIVLACLTTLLIAGSANAWNDYLDVEIDRVNQPQRPLPAGQVSLRQAKYFSFALAGLSLLLAAFINWPAFLIVLASNALLYYYSLRLKSTVLMGNATVAMISALSAIFGGVAASNIGPTLWLALIIATAII